MAYVDQLHRDAPGRPTDGMTHDALEGWIERLVQAGVDSPAVPSLLAGRAGVDDLDRPVLLALADPRLESVAVWSDALAQATYSSLLVCSAQDFGSPGHIGPADGPLLLGHGLVVASRGLTGRPLVGLPLNELRRELEQSRAQLSSAVGYPVHVLVPEPNALGAAVDGLVLRQARRAGYRMVCQPGRAVNRLEDQSGPVDRLQYRIVRTDDAPSHLSDWVVDKGLARPVARMRDLVNRPRRILSRFGLQ